jgi:lipoprotein-releasing system ATP-binding protein
VRRGWPRRDLSGGQQQRGPSAGPWRDGAAGAVRRTDGNLDTGSADEVFELMRRLKREYRTSLLVVTHEPRIAARCQRVIENRGQPNTSDRPNSVA